MIWLFTVTAENCQHQQFPEILGTNFQVAATIPEKDWGNVRQSVLLPKIKYTQLYIDYLKDKDPSSVKFFDESGIPARSFSVRYFALAVDVKQLLRNSPAYIIKSLSNSLRKSSILFRLSISVKRFSLIFL